MAFFIPDFTLDVLHSGTSQRNSWCKRLSAILNEPCLYQTSPQKGGFSAKKKLHGGRQRKLRKDLKKPRRKIYILWSNLKHENCKPLHIVLSAMLVLNPVYAGVYRGCQRGADHRDERRKELINRWISQSDIRNKHRSFDDIIIYDFQDWSRR